MLTGVKTKFRAFVETLKVERKNLVFFLPAGFFLVMGIALAVAPKFILMFLAVTFGFIAACCAFLALKILKFKRRIDRTLEEFKGRVLIQSFDVSDAFEAPKEDSAGKKIILH